MAAFGGLGFATQAQAATPTNPGPVEKLAKEQVSGRGGGTSRTIPSHDFNKDLYCSGVPALFAGSWSSMQTSSRCVDGLQGGGNQDGSVWTFNIRKDTAGRQFTGVGERLRVVVEAAARPAAPRRTRPSSCTTLRTARHSTRKGDRPKGVGVRAKDDWTPRGDPRGPRGYFPVLAAYPRSPAGLQAAVESSATVDGGGNLVSNGPFTAGGVGPQ